MDLLFTCLLYFTSFGSIFALFASAGSILFLLLKTLALWLVAEPETDASRETRLRPQDLAYLKRAGQ